MHLGEVIVQLKAGVEYAKKVIIQIILVRNINTHILSVLHEMDLSNSTYIR